MSAILLPIIDDADGGQQDVGGIDWDGFCHHVQRTVDAGLTPAINMDTGFANLIDAETRQRALRECQAICGDGPFIGGVYVSDRPGAIFNRRGYHAAMTEVMQFGGVPILFQSFGLTSLPDDRLISAYEDLAAQTDGLYFFELGKMFAGFGRIYSDDAYQQLMKIPQMLGAKHSSLHREPEWRRLAMRDATRPEFKVLTGNDLAIDMVMYGSDYLLGLSTFAPDAFSRRDEMWANGDPAFYELNDLLQYLGTFAFRRPVPAYKHSAAMFLKLRGWIDGDDTLAGSPMRPMSDRGILELIADDLQRSLSSNQTTA